MMQTGSKTGKFFIKHADALIAAVAGFIMVSIYTHYSGIGISPDSIMYMSTARNLNAGQGLNFWGHQPIVLFPVFYPIFLAIIQLCTQADPLILGPFIDGVLFGTLVFLSGMAIECFVHTSKVYKWIILMAIVLSPGLLEIYTMLWSETLFMVWMLVFVFAYHQYFKTHTLKALAVIITVAAFACITRYAAITLVGTGGLLLLFDPVLKLKSKIVHIIVFGAGSVLLLALNLVRNAMVTSNSTGTRYKSLTSLSENMHYFGTVMCDWLTIGPKLYALAFTVTLLIVIVFIGIFLYQALINKKYFGSYEHISITFFIVYALFMVIWASISRFERLNNRLMSPCFVPMLLGGTFWISGAIKQHQGKFKLAFIGLAVCAGLFLIYGEAMSDYQRYDDECDYGIPGYTDDSWNKSDLILYMKKHPQLFKPGYPVYNNAVEAFYFFTGQGSDYIPKKAERAKLEKLYKLKHFYLVSFDLLPDTALVPLKQISEAKPLKTIFKNADGGIYFFDESAK